MEGYLSKDAMQEAQETCVWSLDGEDPLEEGMTTHSSSLAGEPPWTEEPGGPQSIGSQRVGYDWSNLAHMHAYVRNDQICGLEGQGWRYCGWGKRNKLQREKLEAIASDWGQDFTILAQDTDGGEGEEWRRKAYLGQIIRKCLWEAREREYDQGL